jgi:hypothetical protein
MNEVESKTRLYTHVIVHYGTVEELKGLFNQARHYAYIVHDRTEGTDKHIHAIITFEREKSFAWVRKQVVSEQNTFTEPLKGDVQDVLEYFTHKGTDKEQYEEKEIVYDNKSYWQKRAKSGEREENKNDEFVDDLTSPNYSVEFMSRKYGSDYMRNMLRYEEVRYAILNERKYKSQSEEEQKQLKEREDAKKRLEEGIAYLNQLNWQM